MLAKNRSFPVPPRNVSAEVSLKILLTAKLDDFRNNSSLALAIERIADGSVLLFPADAQEGNWLSWHDSNMKWDAMDASGTIKTVVPGHLHRITKLTLWIVGSLPMVKFNLYVPFL